ncbi:MAG: RNA methyltransferase [Bacteroidetes bacterium]|nr:RNA methyltransferase [Bacteroidota bacterium]
MRKLKNNELNRLNLEEFKSSQKTPIVVVLDNVRSAHNVGAVFRTSDAFLLEKVCLCGITPTPPHKEIRKTALGASESLNWEYFESTLNCIDSLKAEGFHIISIEQAEKALMLHNFHPEMEGKYAIVFGNEVKGVDQTVVSNSNTVIEIPQFGTKHSLNISVSTGIVIWDLFQKMQS